MRKTVLVFLGLVFAISSICLAIDTQQVPKRIDKKPSDIKPVGIKDSLTAADLVIDNVRITQLPTQANGYELRFDITIVNKGSKEAVKGNRIPAVKFKVDNTQFVHYLGATRKALAPGEAHTANYGLYCTEECGGCCGLDSGRHRLTAVIDSMNDIRELNEENNTFTVDFNIP